MEANDLNKSGNEEKDLNKIDPSLEEKKGENFSDDTDSTQEEKELFVRKPNRQRKLPRV
ncbi:hypothetical protein [Saccharicrinis fermentans]|uniref:Uncharacterized protein n=1 Tax=Saccharicrinis fermentans DSM 9555 = JCM 21142 TaxID=869213 RepID=W7Y878_9BACT|nr:hypothetical protein [Saccharicrinis fermentans]GAF03903.1 hypothetical protein JCM21142_72592 [Saccharicrinis fermentans DSM 9555 = JCM 21142]